MSGSRSTPTAVKLDPAMKERIEKLAESRRRSPHWLMKEAIGEYVAREEMREAFRQDAIKAWEEYEANGLSVSAEKADIWLAELERGGDVEPPEASR
jgi:predicted transcriptional regulator